ncbi:MAG: sugar ABC transporter permease [Candidatus Borkfalkiaceae bacterium]|nr:sugar ABC transporter permease [Christensenellaceae bacterium]
MTTQTNRATTQKITSKQTKRLLFYVAAVTLPLLQFLIFYLYVNINSIILAFQKYSEIDGAYVKVFASFENFGKAFQVIGESWNKISNSLKMIACDVFISLPLALIFSFYIYKKFFLHKTFKVMLFMPQIISGIVFVMLFKYIANNVYQELTGKTGLLMSDDENVKMATVLFYNVWISFGVNVMMFTGSMSGIDGSIVEAVALDGASLIQEFFYVTMPMIWSTFSTFVVISLTGIFTHQLNLFAFYGEGAGRLESFGYFLYIQSLKPEDRTGVVKGTLTYSQLSALGLVLTMITLPIVLVSRKLMTKLGPSMD